MHQVLDIVKARISDPAVAALVGCVRIEQMKTCLPLQAADVLCWHLQRYFSGSFNRTEENRMWYLLKERTGFLRRWKRDELESVSRDLEMTGQT